MTESELLLGRMASLTKRIVECPFKSQCRAECPSLTVDNPMPDYVGEAYDGLVILASNPGPAKPGVSSQREMKRNEAAAAVARTPTAASQRELSRVTAWFMEIWKTALVSLKWRRMLSYDIRKVAFINVVKCRSSETFNDPTRLSMSVARRCFEAHTVPLLALLNPRVMVAQWKGTLSGLHILGFENATGIPAFNGRRSVPDHQKAAPLMVAFREAALSPSPIRSGVIQAENNGQIWSAP